MEINELDTPALMVDYEIVKNNICKEQLLANTYGKKLRPHIKTHKNVKFAQMQIDAGAVGICTAKVSEAEVMVYGGIKDILIANEIVGEEKLSKLVYLAHMAKISTLVDSLDVLIPLSKAAREESVHIGVYVEIDLGDNRCGTSIEDSYELARKIEEDPFLDFLGIETFGGFVFHTKDKETEEENVEKLRSQIQKIIRPVRMT